VCDPPAPDVEAFISFSAQGEDGTVTGTYTFSAPDVFFTREGVITEGTTDGNTYTLSGENESVYGTGSPPQTVVDEITISGDCGDDVTIRYVDPATVATFTGDVECTLLA
jgi:hypothetical protein